MKKEDAIAGFGSQQKLAKFLGVAQSNVSAWKTIPRRHIDKIQKYLSGEPIQSEELQETKMQRYMCFIEQRYIDILKEHAQKTGLPVVEILRRAIKYYDKNV